MLRVQSCRGVAPAYGPEQRAQLRRVLFAARHLLAEATDALWDSRSGEDLLPLLLQARTRPAAFLGACRRALLELCMHACANTHAASCHSAPPVLSYTLGLRS